MTNIAMFSQMQPLAGEPRDRYYRNSLKLYQVEVHGFESDEIEVYEVEARNEAEAEIKGVSRATFSVDYALVYLL